MKFKFDNTNLPALRREEIAPTKIRELNGIYDEHQKLVFLFDCSGSMHEMVATGYEDQYVWTPGMMAKIRKGVEEAWARIEQLKQEDPLVALLGSDPNDRLLASFCDAGGLCSKPDTDLQQDVIRHNLLTQFDIPIDFIKHTEVPPSRMQVVKKLAVSELRRRVEKYPNGSLAVIKFGTAPTIIFDDGNIDQLWATLEAMDAHEGCTNILAAVEAGLDVCRRNPSKVGVHHFVLVTDGEDWNASNNIGQWVPTLKASGVTLDYIHIGDLERNGAIEKACKDLGGEYVTVNSVREFTEKFVEAIKRRCLPPAS